MLGIKTEGPRNLAFVLSEGNGKISRDVVTIASGAGKLEPGTILGRIVLGSAAATPKAGGNTGAGTISAVTVGDGAKVGVYKVVFTAATKFNVFDPDGFSISKGSTGVAFDDDIGFTITASGDAFVADDGFDIVVGAGSGSWVPSPDTSDNGSHVARGILAYGVDATSAAAEAVIISRQAEVKEPMLIFHSSVDNTNKRTAKLGQLAAVAIIAR